MKSRLPDVGDIIKSSKFVFGHYSGKKKKLVIIDGDDRVENATSGGNTTRPKRRKGMVAGDESRATAEFVVEVFRMEGGGTGHGHHDVYPEEWYVQARRLRGDDSYDPEGEVISFYVGGGYLAVMELRDVELVGRMKMMFVRVL
jgi:hypothetical protein